MITEITLGSLSIELPSYMIALSQSEIDKIFSSYEKDQKQKIIAAGVHPSDKTITLVLSSGEIMCFDSHSYFIPEGKFIPMSDGNNVFLPNENNRWPSNTRGFKVESSWIISKSKPLSSEIDAELLINNNFIANIKI